MVDGEATRSRPPPGGQTLEEDAMPSHVGLWLDHRHAIIVTARGHDFTVDHEELTIEPSDRGAGGLRAHGPGSPGQTTHGVDPDQRFRAREAQEVDRFYERLLPYLEPAETIHVIGPGTAKTELRRKIAEHKPLAGKPLEVASADQMTEAQVVATLRAKLGIPAPRSMSARS
jgi:hypothetical protein